MDQRGGRALGAVLGGRGGTGDGIRLRPPGPRQHPARTRRRAEQRVGQPVGRGYAPDTREPGIKSRRGRSPDLRPQLAKPGSKAVGGVAPTYANVPDRQGHLPSRPLTKTPAQGRAFYPSSRNSPFSGLFLLGGTGSALI